MTYRLNLHICHQDLSVMSRCPYSFFFAFVSCNGFSLQKSYTRLTSKAESAHNTQLPPVPQALICSIFFLFLLRYMHRDKSNTRHTNTSQCQSDKNSIEYHHSTRDVHFMSLQTIKLQKAKIHISVWRLYDRGSLKYSIS